MLPYEATLVVTLRLPISLDAEDREAAHSQMQARVAEARFAGALESVRVDDLVAILAHSDPSRTIPVRRVATHTEEVCEDRNPASACLFWSRIVGGEGTDAFAASSSDPYDTPHEKHR